MSSDAMMKRWLEQLENKYGERRRADFQREVPKVQSYLGVLTAALSATYELEKPLAVGGTGIVFVGNHRRFLQPIVLKFNRPIAPHEKSMVQNESQILPTLSHPNIIHVLDLGVVEDQEPKLTYIVEPFIAGARPLFTFDKERVDETWLKTRLHIVRDSLPSGHRKAQADDSVCRRRLFGHGIA